MLARASSFLAFIPKLPPPAHLGLVLSGLIALSDPALATSRAFEKPATKRLAATTTTPGSCRVSARFIEAKPKRGKAVWVFERLENLSPPCSFDSSRFEVWIWQGSYSTLSRSIAYPMHVNEPKTGEVFELGLTRRHQRELPSEAVYSGWFLVEGDNALKARAP
jgi:hypothetical protein